MFKVQRAQVQSGNLFLCVAHGEGSRDQYLGWDLRSCDRCIAEAIARGLGPVLRGQAAGQWYRETPEEPWRCTKCDGITEELATPDWTKFPGLSCCKEEFIQESRSVQVHVWTYVDTEGHRRYV